MSKKDDFLDELEVLFQKYDVANYHTEMSKDIDAGEDVIVVDIPVRARYAKHGVV